MPLVPHANGNGNGTGARPREQAHLRSLWNFVQRNRWLVFGVPALVLLATGAFVRYATPIYEATGSLRVDEEASSIPVLDALKSLSQGNKIDTEMEVLRSRTLAEDVVDSLGLALGVRHPRRVVRSALFSAVRVDHGVMDGDYRFRPRADGRFDVLDDETGKRLGVAAVGEPARIPGATLTLAPGARGRGDIVVRTTRYQKAIKEFRNTLEVDRPNRDADVVQLRYQGPDQELVTAVPNVMAAMFLHRRHGIRNTEALSTARFLRSQIDTLSVQLATAENELKEFREQHQVVSPEAEAKAQVASLVDMQAQRDMVDAERGALASLLDEVKATPTSPGGPSPMRRLIAFPTLFKNPAASELLRSLSEVENERAELLNRRTPEDPDVQVLTDRVHQLEAQLGAIATTYLQGLTNQVASLDAVLGRFSGTLERIPATEIEYARLERQAKLIEDIYTLLQTRLKEAEIAAAVDDPTVRVVDPAVLPYKPIRPDPPLSLGLGLLVGLVLGFGLAFGREQMDNSIRTREDLQWLGGDVPVLGAIPRFRAAGAANGNRWRRVIPVPIQVRPLRVTDRLAAIRDPHSPISEAYRSLRTNITFSRPERTPKTLVFTSAAPGDGKSTSTANLAAILAQQGLRCLLVDADLRRGELHESLKARREPGLSNVLVGAADVTEAIQTVEVEGVASFGFIATGPYPPNPAELLASARMRQLVERLESEYDAVLVDAPPLNVVTDAAVLGPYADGVIVVARAGVTDRGALQYAMEQLRAVRAPILGSILNDIDQRTGRYYGVYGTYQAYRSRG